MPADNHLYTTQANGWWDENHFLHTLKTGLNPARFTYFERILRQSVPPSTLPTLTVLDLGCGGGILSEEFARLGCHVTGLDPSTASLRVARAHAAHSGLTIAYHTGAGEALPYPPAHFDVVVCCDVLEHVHDLPAVIAETARVLKPGGFYFFDTINRTFQSWFETIFIGQQLPLTAFFAPNTHAWAQFIPPAELTSHLRQRGLEAQELTGLRPGIPAPWVALHLLRRKLGFIPFAELGRRLKFTTGGGLGGSYIGWARKNLW